MQFSFSVHLVAHAMSQEHSSWRPVQTDIPETGNQQVSFQEQHAFPLLQVLGRSVETCRTANRDAGKLESWACSPAGKRGLFGHEPFAFWPRGRFDKLINLCLLSPGPSPCTPSCPAVQTLPGPSSAQNPRGVRWQQRVAHRTRGRAAQPGWPCR